MARINTLGCLNVGIRGSEKLNYKSGGGYHQIYPEGYGGGTILS